MTRFKRVKDTIKPSNIIKALKDHWNRTFRLAAEKVPTFDARDKKKRSGSLFRPSRFDRNQKKRNGDRLLRNEGQINILERTNELQYLHVTIFIQCRYSFALDLARDGTKFGFENGSWNAVEEDRHHPDRSMNIYERLLHSSSSSSPSVHLFFHLQIFINTMPRFREKRAS